MPEGTNDLSAVLTELQNIKKLFILILLQQGISQIDIAAALGVNPSTVTRMLPKGLGKRVRPSSPK